MTRLLTIIILAASLAACGVVSMLTDGIKYARAVEADLDASMGSKPQVGFSWNNGRLTQVTVTFPHLVETTSLREMAATVRASIEKHFPQKAEHIVLGFSLAESPARQALLNVENTVEKHAHLSDR